MDIVDSVKQHNTVVLILGIEGAVSVRMEIPMLLKDYESRNHRLQEVHSGYGQAGRRKLGSLEIEMILGNMGG